MIRFMGTKEQADLFRQLKPEIRDAMLNGFKIGVLEALRFRPLTEINQQLASIDHDYDEIMASRIDASKSGV